MIKGSITLRWLINTILVIAVVLSVITVTASLILKYYYYESASFVLNSVGKSASVANFFSGSLGAGYSTFENRAKDYVENSSDINKMEIWVLDGSGNVVVSSTGFETEKTEMPDYEIAKESVAGTGEWIGKHVSGEKIAVLTVMLPYTGGVNNGAVRYMISLEDIDRQHAVLTIIISSVASLALVLVILSGLFFVRSIVRPVKRLNEITQRIAAGDYSDRITFFDNHDEISHLCTSINYMTEQISRTEKIKNDFISTVSHELRTPLTAIKGWGETLLDSTPQSDEITYRGLEVILSESERLYSIVEDLLDFSKMQDGKLSLRIKKMDILAELDEAVYVFRDRATREGKEIFYSAPDCPAQMKGDADRIKQVFVNVLDNALKYTQSGGRINIVAILEQNSVKIVIADNGCGISPEDLPRVKEKFYKANPTVKGSGIGLAVCDEIISLHKGKLDIESNLGDGTSVTITLPVSPISIG